MALPHFNSRTLRNLIQQRIGPVRLERNEVSNQSVTRILRVEGGPSRAVEALGDAALGELDECMLHLSRKIAIEIVVGPFLDQIAEKIVDVRSMTGQSTAQNSAPGRPARSRSSKVCGRPDRNDVRGGAQEMAPIAHSVCVTAKTLC
jgi:hypothetical protein